MHSDQCSSATGKRYYNPTEILAFKPYTEGAGGNTERAVAFSKSRSVEAGVWHDRQVLGRRYPIGCVALEVTQRCNLDCTLCYLSENSESVKDIPIEEVFRRIDLIKDHYGAGTDVQITGGDPTLRDADELVQIVKRVKMLGMNPTLMTNGLKASRALLERLIAVGLKDVAFHVDLTQERKPYKTEKELNKVRLSYVERARGLPIHVIFNTTVFKDNFAEIPDLIKFFREHSDVVQFASFQLQADTGRGELRKRDGVISMETVWEQIEKGSEVKLPFEAIQIGHGDCNRYSVSLTANGKMFPLLDNPKFISDFMEASDGIILDRTDKWKTAKSLFSWMGKNPKLTGVGIFKFLIPKALGISKDLIASKGKFGKLTFFVHNFMDASQLECDRIGSCSFMVMTTDGPISMCMHNAKRDEFILKPFQVTAGDQKKTWSPLTGETVV